MCPGAQPADEEIVDEMNSQASHPWYSRCWQRSAL
jgi:hypothetical protein